MKIHTSLILAALLVPTTFAFANGKAAAVKPDLVPDLGCTEKKADGITYRVAIRNELVKTDESVSNVIRVSFKHERVNSPTQNFIASTTKQKQSFKSFEMQKDGDLVLTESLPITVKATDKAGNDTIETLPNQVLGVTIKKDGKGYKVNVRTKDFPVFGRTVSGCKVREAGSSNNNNMFN